MCMNTKREKSGIFFVTEILPCKFKHKKSELIQTFQRCCQRGQSVRMWTHELGWCISPHLTAGCDKSPWACSGMYLCICSSEWQVLKKWMALLCFLHVSASAPAKQSNSDVYWCTFKEGNEVIRIICRKQWKIGLEKIQDSATIHLPLSLCIHSHIHSCLWQKQWHVIGATKINHPLPSAANKCKHLRSHIDMQLCGCIHPVH